jgi:cobalt/nickel transport system ATP-binding protein
MDLVNPDCIFEAKNLSFDYPGKIPALRKINFTIYPGDRVALLGANGSGKSTLLRILDGLSFPSEGDIIAFGRKLSEQSLKERNFMSGFRRQVGLVFQDSDVQLFCPTVWDEVTFGPLQLGITKEQVIARAQEALELMGISHLKDRPPYLLSGGEKKKVSIASVLSIQPSVLLMDEPTSGLDPRSQGILIDFLLQWSGEGKTLIFSTQDLDIVEEIASRAIVMDSQHGIIADGDPTKFLDDAEFLTQTNLIHIHSHRHKILQHSHPHLHEHEH